MTPSPIAMGTIKAMIDAIKDIIVKCQSAHEMSVYITQQGELWQLASKPQGGLANKCNKGVMRTLYHDNTHPATTIFVKGASITMGQAQQIQITIRRSSKQEISGRLAILMPQISCDKNLRTTTKHEIKNSCKTIK
jgi:hypothetical protein